MDQFILIAYSIYQSQSTVQKHQNWKKAKKKEEIVPKNFDAVYRAVFTEREWKLVTIIILLIQFSIFLELD